MWAQMSQERVRRRRSSAYPARAHARHALTAGARASASPDAAHVRRGDHARRARRPARARAARLPPCRGATLARHAELIGRLLTRVVVSTPGGLDAPARDLTVGGDRRPRVERIVQLGLLEGVQPLDQAPVMQLPAVLPVQMQRRGRPGGVLDEPTLGAVRPGVTAHRDPARPAPARRSAHHTTSAPCACARSRRPPGAPR